ncbi:YaaA family protein [Fusobacterium sp. OBRC1]|uniref:YaaA family protein n=1 Tax=Fusobacterium sp. OBRC1 TaxID=1032505 RepID=UPI00044F0A15|nr:MULTISPECIES: YaaA family protein [Fusobacterium]EUB30226.1 PF03883 family protein [Fusobacterium sp. OBRC1]WCB32210.1 YaaA family protein [Fusobacterium nucleatum]
MKIIFSPSKEMREENIFENKKIEFTESKFKDKTNILIGILKEKLLSEIENIMKLKGELLNKTYKDIQDYDKLKFIPAISMYYGVSFKELNLEDYSEKSLEYLKNNLLILSALYGVLLAFDLVKKYRLDMTMSIIDKGLYNFWKKDINDYISNILSKDEVLLNLASGEFSKLIDNKKISMINIDFKEEKDGAYKSVSTYSKKARGQFLNYLIKNQIANLEDIKKIKLDGYSLNKDLSDEKNLIFTRKNS